MAFAPVSGEMVIAAGGDEIRYARVTASRTVRCRIQHRDVFDGMTTRDHQDGSSEKTGAGVKDSRRDRLKLALRENLKRRKSQARGRGDVASSETGDTSLDTGGGKS
ncbi:hypothetical protein [Bradyrhizobium roseum]|uniref:hypothetical protein n=1 Tax=Bradyrhizobium roseum TaxID=3056648 RepID=UPI00261E8E52|nr:hypothetical protein [Bradyrhizobium roseus]WKA29345.1 hypothetical protein QUH67_03905 [Bradyrhizobium roseus]